MRAPPRSIGVLGGGTAGYFAALAIKRRFPQLAVTVIESSAVPIIGVGEATTTLMPPFLHVQLGLSIHELNRLVRPTFKLGIHFDWGRPGDYAFDYPFGDADPLHACCFDGHLRTQSLTAMAMHQGRAPVLRGPQGQVLSLLTEVKFAYHLENVSFVGFLAAAAQAAGIGHVDCEVIDTTRRDDGGIDKLRAADGRELGFDFYVDASGFRSQLLERTLGVPFESYASSLFCDRAVIATVPQRGIIEPYTTAETMNAGWCWRIPTRDEDHRGYVYASAFLDDDAARDELCASNPGARDIKLVRFRSGRHRVFWRHNVAAIGNAYGFVEPLESTALHMVIVQLAYLLELLGSPEPSPRVIDLVNDSVGAHWDYLRWFLALHYKFNRRRDTEFWRAARGDVELTGLEPYVEQFRRDGASYRTDRLPIGDPGYGPTGLLCLLFGQQVDAPAPTPTLARAEWDERVARDRKVISHALPQAEALELLDADPSMYQRFVEHPASWCRRQQELPTLTRATVEAVRSQRR